MEILDNVVNNNRICYVDPNDVRGNINGVPLTPDYTEFCIWCNLIVERSTRLKNQSNDDYGNTTYAIAFDMTRADKGSNPVSFMQGKDAVAYNFLSTDYTNIDFQEVKKRNIVEGLQIENVQIAFVNYQTPQVTIKFVDIRGGGFFGREEATHDEYGHMSNLEMNRDNNIIDNFYGCFVTFPYPRFRLQVKGFYGKPVTFQLTCTSFNGNFNAQTGNFEIVVQFIGYEYGVLGDIPFDLLVAAPMTDTGKAYWDEQVANMANNGWALDKEKREAPYLLFDFFQKVDAATQGMDDDDDVENVVDESTADIMKGIKIQASELNDIRTAIADFKQKTTKTFHSYYVTDYSDDEENVMIIYSKSEDYDWSNNLIDFCDSYNNLGHLIANYNAQYKDEKLNLLYDGEFKKWEPSVFRFDKGFISHVSEGINQIKDTVTILNLNGGGKTYKLSDGVKQKINQDLLTRNWGIYGLDYGGNISFAGFGLAIIIGNTVKEIDNKLTELETKYENYKNRVNAADDKSIREVVGFSPYVGRYFKNVMCHLETLVYLFNKCADGIEEQLLKGERTPAALGIRDLAEQTDVPPGVFKGVPPFPAVYKKYTTNEENNEILNGGGNIKANAWIGDFGDNWKEEDLVDELYKAAQRIAASRAEMKDSEPGVYNEPGYDSLMPVDYFFGVPAYAYSSKDGAMLYAALRAEVALNFMQGGKKVDVKEAEDLGMYDAYIYTKQCGNETFLNSLSDSDRLQKEFYDGTVYTNDFKTKEPKRYEFAKVYNERQPVFIDNGAYVKYQFMTNNDNKSEIIPLENHETLNQTNGFANDYLYNNGKDFNPKDLKSGKYLVGNTQESVSEHYYDKYENTHHFDVIIDKSKVETIKAGYKEFKDGKIKINGKSSSDLMETINKHVLMEDGRIDKYSIDTPKTVYKTYKDCGIDITTLEKNSVDDKEIIKKFKDGVKF